MRAERSLLGSLFVWWTAGGKVGAVNKFAWPWLLVDLACETQEEHLGNVDLRRSDVDDDGAS